MSKRRRGEMVFEWKNKWYTLGKGHKATGYNKVDYIILPDGTLLKNPGHYNGGLVLVQCYADLMGQLVLVQLDPHEGTAEEVAKKLNAVPATAIERLYISYDDENWT